VLRDHSGHRQGIGTNPAQPAPAPTEAQMAGTRLQRRDNKDPVKATRNARTAGPNVGSDPISFVKNTLTTAAWPTPASPSSPAPA
jgi:hypothetical protein